MADEEHDDFFMVSNTYPRNENKYVETVSLEEEESDVFSLVSDADSKKDYSEAITATLNLRGNSVDMKEIVNNENSDTKSKILYKKDFYASKNDNGNFIPRRNAFHSSLDSLSNSNRDLGSSFSSVYSDFDKLNLGSSKLRKSFEGGLGSFNSSVESCGNRVGYDLLQAGKSFEGGLGSFNSSAQDSECSLTSEASSVGGKVTRRKKHRTKSRKDARGLKIKRKVGSASLEYISQQLTG